MRHPISMAKLTYRERKRLPRGVFVFPNGTEAQPGRKMFPIDTIGRARNALSRAAQDRIRLTPAERCRLVRAVCRKYKSIGVCAGVTKSKRLGACKLK